MRIYKMKKKMQKKDKIALAVFLAIGALAVFFEWFYPLDRIVMDRMYQKPSVASEKIKIIRVDEKALKRFGPFSGWDRSRYAKLLKELNREQANRPHSVIFDITYSGNMNAKGDQEFAEAARASGNVTVADTVLFQEKVKNGKTGSILDSFHVEGVEAPFDQLNAAAARGFSNTLLDRDGKIRHGLLTVTYRGKKYKSLGYQTALRLADAQKLQLKLPQTDRYGRFGFTYTARSGDYDSVSMADVLDGKIDPKWWKDSVVMVGAYATGMRDSHYVPVEQNKEMYGVEIQANIAEALVNGTVFQQLDQRIVLGYSLGILLIFAWILMHLKMPGSGIAVLGGIGIHVLLGIFLYSRKFEMPLVTVPVLMVLFYGYEVVESYVMERLQKAKIVASFKKYVAPQVVDEMMAKGNLKPLPGGVVRDVAVIFVDIRGFTPLSEKLQAEEVVEILNEYLELTTQAVFHYEGTLDKFIGDATMAVFNSPFDQKDYEYRAISAAWEIAQGSEAIRKTAQERFGVEVGFGIGVHCGRAVAGNIGSTVRMDYTVIGDTVNTAARLESNAKAGQILISPEMKRRLGSRIASKEIGSIPLKGKQEPMMLYEVCGIVQE